MSLLSVIIVLVVVGVVLYLVNRIIPMDAKIKLIINWLVVIVVIIWLLKISGILNYFDRIKI
jgi:hypothetical protein